MLRSRGSPESVRPPRVGGGGGGRGAAERPPEPSLWSLGRPQRPGARAPRRRLPGDARGAGLLRGRTRRRALSTCPGTGLRRLRGGLSLRFQTNGPELYEIPRADLIFKDAFCKSVRPCPGDTVPEAFALGMPGQGWDLLSDSAAGGTAGLRRSSASHQSTSGI